MSSKKKSDPNERIRPVGEPREAIIEHKLTQIQLDGLKDNVMDLLDQREDLKEKAKEVVTNYKSQIATCELTIESTRRTIRSGRRQETIQVQEFLTRSNEVIRVRTDTGAQIGTRTATARELQEELFGEKPPVAGEKTSDDVPGDVLEEDPDGVPAFDEEVS
jgi:hypothetical protein